MSGISPAQERKDHIATQRWERRCEELEFDPVDLFETLVRHSGALTKAQIEAVGDAINASPQSQDIIRALAAADTDRKELP